MMTNSIAYRPSNSTEGDIFETRWCQGCGRYRNGSCGLLLNSMFFDIHEKDYPTEWVRLDGVPTCTAFRKPAPKMTRVPENQMGLFAP